MNVGWEEGSLWFVLNVYLSGVLESTTIEGEVKGNLDHNSPWINFWFLKNCNWFSNYKEIVIAESFFLPDKV